MRLWHKDLIPVLPRQQLLAQWRECCCIARNISVNGTPNHILVNKIMDYPMEHLVEYALEVRGELVERGYSCNWTRFSKHLIGKAQFGQHIEHEDLFKGWHNHRYLLQCFYNLQEKYDCGGITQEEWNKIVSYMENSTDWRDTFA